MGLATKLRSGLVAKPFIFRSLRAMRMHQPCPESIVPPLSVPDRPLRIAFLGECMIELSDLAAADGRVAMGVAGDTLNGAIY